METKQQTKELPKPTGKRPTFCLRLNAFRALSCLSVILTHIVSFSGLVQTFPSFHFGGHQAVYFFFNLSGYLLSLSLIKEVKRRVYAHKKKTTSGDDERGLVPTNSQSDQIELSPVVIQPKPSLAQKIKSSLLACIVGKYLWNRMWKTFPMYWGAWLVLKTFAHEGTRVQTLRPSNTWAQILGLKIFPGHLWTMRIDMMFYFYVTPIYICFLYGAFKLQKEGFKKASKVAFAAIIGCLIGIAIYGIHMVPGCLHPFKYEEIFVPNLPPFCFGMMAGLINFALEKRFNARQAANAQEPREASESEGQDDSFVGKIKAFLLRNKYSIIFAVVFLRIISLNPGMYFFFYPDNIPAEAAPTWQIANWHSYWYGIFILINDTRGGFWKFMHPVEAKPTALHPSPVHKVIYHFGLWSYAIYLTHPISYDLLKRLFPNQQYTVEYWTGSIIIAFAIGVFVDFVFDKLFTEKLIMGKIFKSSNKVIVKKENVGQELESAKAASS